MTDQEILDLYWKEITFPSATDEEIIQYTRALLSRAIPEGHVVVPKEPTIEMIAALGFRGDTTLAIGHSAICEEITEDYRAMIAAAPANKEGA